eukprot:8477223-Alexandrium_andersonii.AAC.1
MRGRDRKQVDRRRTNPRPARCPDFKRRGAPLLKQGEERGRRFLLSDIARSRPLHINIASHN